MQGITVLRKSVGAVDEVLLSNCNILREDEDHISYYLLEFNKKKYLPFLF